MTDKMTDKETDTININKIKYSKVIKTIYHLSDIHVHLYKRHDEYQKIFNSLYKFLESEKRKLKIKNNDNISIIMVITGDILHCKSDLSPECVNFTYNMFKRLASILPVVVIPGNHDVNMNNHNSLDSITPIIADLNEKFPIHYLNHTGIWIMNNIVFTHSSIYDYQIITKDQLNNLIEDHKFNKEASENIRSIYLFHGRINGVEINNGLKLTGELDKKTNKTITLSSFKDYDLALFGDVHRHYFLSETQAYAGSFIQQNFGESIKNHGIIKWDILEKKGEFIEFINTVGYYTLYINNNKILNKDNKDNNDNLLFDITKDDPIKLFKSLLLPKKLYLRIFYSKTEKSLIYDMINKLKEKYEILQITYQEESSYYIKNDDESDKNNKSNYLNIQNIEHQNNILKKILIEDFSLNNKEDVELIDSILNINKKFNKTYIDSENIKSESQKYKLLSLKFNNLFSYGENNFIDFKDMKGIVGIIAPNHTGKSALLDIILFVLYDKFSRKGNIKDIINNKCNDYYVKLELQMGTWRYVIIKSGSKTKDEKLSESKCNFYRQNIITGREERLEKDTIKKTKMYISNIFGDYEDSINTTFSIQTNATGFIDCESSKRRAELERILHMDFINILQKQANANYKDNKSVFEHLQKTMPPEQIIKLQDNIKLLEETLNSKNKINNNLINECDRIQKEINELNKKYNNSVDDKLNKILNLENSNLEPKEILNNEKINIEYDKYKLEIENKNKLIEEYNLKITKYLNKLKINNINDLDNYKIEIKNNKIKLISDLQNLTYDYKNNEKELNNILIKLNKNLKDKNLKDIDKIILDTKEELNNINDLEYYDNKISECHNKKELYIDKINNKNSELDKLSLPDNLLELIKNTDIEDLKELINSKINFNNFKKIKTADELNDLISKIKELGFIEGLYENSKEGPKSKELKNKIKIYKNKRDKIIKEIEEYNKKKEHKIKLDNELLLFKNYKIINEKIDDKELEIKKVKEEIDLIDKNFDYLNKISDYEINIKKVNLEKETINLKINQLKTLEVEMDKLLEEMENNNNIQLEIIKLTDNLSLRTEENKKLIIEIDNIKEEINKNKGLLESIKENAKIKKEKELLMTMYKYYADALKIMPFKLLKQIELLLEQRINEFLISAMANFTIKFKITDNKIDIFLCRKIYGKKKIIINNCSGFERFITSLAIRMSLLEITQLSSINMMAVDEGWSCFDKENIANLDIIFNYLCQKFNFILIISHMDTIKQHCDIQINLKIDEETKFTKVEYYK